MLYLGNLLVGSYPTSEKSTTAVEIARYVMLSVAQFQQWCLRLHLSPQASEVVARVRSSPPARRVGSRANNVSGTYASRKMGCTIQFESHKVELWAIYTMEHDPQVLEYYDQPTILEIHYQAKSGCAITVSHTPDFLVLMQDGAWFEEWKQEDKLLELAISQPHRYQRDERGGWRCPPGEEAAQLLGLSYRVRSSAELSPHAIRNLIFLEDYFFAPDVEPSLTTRIVDRVRNFPGMSLTALKQEDAQIPLDAVYALVARSSLYVDLEARPLIEHKAVLLYPDRATAEAHALLHASHVRAESAFEGERPSRHLALTAGSRALWDGRIWTLINLGHTMVTLCPEEGSLMDVPLSSFLDLIDAGRITVPRTAPSPLIEHLHPEAERLWRSVSLREAYVTSLDLGGARVHHRVLYDEEFVMATLPSPRNKTAKVVPGHGVKLHYLFYWNDALRHPEVDGTRVPIRYDPFNVGIAYAYVRGQWVRCISQFHAAFQGHSEKELALATEVLRQQARISHKAVSMTPQRLVDFLADVHAHERVLMQRLRDQEAQGVLECLAIDTPKKPSEVM
jgi:hypothetical protein